MLLRACLFHLDKSDAIYFSHRVNAIFILSTFTVSSETETSSAGEQLVRDTLDERQ